MRNNFNNWQLFPIAFGTNCLLFCCCLMISACTQDYQPKPKGYNRLVLPKEEYRLLPDTLPLISLTLYSKSAKLLKDTSWMSETILGNDLLPGIESEYPYYLQPKRLHGKEAVLRGELMNDALQSYRQTTDQGVNAIDELITKTRRRRAKQR